LNFAADGLGKKQTLKTICSDNSIIINSQLVDRYKRLTLERFVLSFATDQTVCKWVGTTSSKISKLVRQCSLKIGIFYILVLHLL
jgi:hypothetical protein